LTLHRQGLPWREGRGSCIRPPTDQGHVRFFSASFLVDATLVHEYVKGTIATRTGRLTFLHQGRIIMRYPLHHTNPSEASYRCAATRNL
jgi:hypothetical protein